MKFNRIAIAKRLMFYKKYKKAKELLLLSANRNNAMAQYLLGYFYFDCRSNMTANESEYWFRKSAKNGSADAIAQLAMFNFKKCRWSSVCDISLKSLELKFKAARKGSAEAQRSLACAYAQGEIIEQNDLLTMYWDEKAARQGLPESQNDLALMLLHGMGGKVDVEQAIYWYQESASKDYNVPYAQWAAEALSRIYSGNPYKEWEDEESSVFWEQRAAYLSKLDLGKYSNFWLMI